MRLSTSPQFLTRLPCPLRQGCCPSQSIPCPHSGLEREPTNFPVPYIGANVPQAWAAGSCFCLLAALVGFQPDAPSGKLYLDPALPDWLPDLLLKDLRLGEKVFDIKFWRDGERTLWRVTRGDAAVVQARPVARGPAFWAPIGPLPDKAALV